MSWPASAGCDHAGTCTVSHDHSSSEGFTIMSIQYYRGAPTWDQNVFDLELNSQGLVTQGQILASGAPAAIAGQYIPGAIMQGSDGLIYVNEGTTAAPVFAQNGSGVLKISLTSAQILALHTTPITLIPAVAGKAIVVDSYVFTMNFFTSAYTGSNAVEYRYTNGSGTKVANDTPSTVLDISSGSQQYSNTGVAAILTQNAPVVAVVPTANPAAGAGNATIAISYRLV